MKTQIEVPEHLSAESKRLWESTLENYAIDDQAAMILQTALEARDRLQEARQAIARDGVTVRDRWQQVKVHPAVTVEATAAQTLCRCWRLLGFDLSATGRADAEN